jgi:hypothetical protein
MLGITHKQTMMVVKKFCRTFLGYFSGYEAPNKWLIDKASKCKAVTTNPPNLQTWKMR